MIFTNEKAKATILTALIVTFIISVPAYLSYKYTKETVISEYGKSSMHTASVISRFIERDIKNYKKLSDHDSFEPGTYDEDYYNEMLSTFRDLKIETGYAFVYTEKKVSDTEFVYILDGENPKSDLFSPIGSKEMITKVAQKAFTQGIPVASGLTDAANWGYFITGYSPIKDPVTHNVIGIVGVDLSAKQVLNIIHQILLGEAICCSLLIIFMTFIIRVLVSQRSKALDFDYVTNTYSKRYYESKLEDCIRKAKRSKQPLSLAMIDIDDFKQINDTLGHSVGDDVLKAIANVMKINIRECDICSRYAGDEFTIILPNTSKEKARLICERIQDNSTMIRTPNVTLSIGIAEWYSGMKAKTFAKNADEAMYISKNKGKNNITIFLD